MNATTHAPVGATAAGRPRPAPRAGDPTEVSPLPVLYEAIFMSLQQVLSLDEADDAAMSQRLTRMAADRFSQFRSNYGSGTRAGALQALYDVEALVRGAYDVVDATAARLRLLTPTLSVLQQATELLSASPERGAQDSSAQAAYPPRASELQRAGWVFGSIMNIASSLRVLCADLMNGLSDHDAGDRCAAMHTLVSQIGLLAEIGEQDLGEFTPSDHPDARAWLLPPAYHHVPTQPGRTS